MAKGFRLDLIQDKEFLEKRLGKEKLRALQKPSSNESIITSAYDNLDKSGKTLSSQGIDLNKPKRSKHGGIKVWCNTLQKKFKSTGEHDYFHILLTLEHNGHISNLTHEERIPLMVNGKLICRFLIDYQFDWNGKHIYADYKPPKTVKITPGFVFKKKLFEAIYNEPVHIIRKEDPGIVSEIRECLSQQNNKHQQ